MPEYGGRIMMWWWPFGAVFMIVCMVMMFRMMGACGMSGSRSYESERERPDAERILANRLASGEIDVEEYERLRDALHRTSGSPRT